MTVYGGWTQMVNAQGEHVEQAKAFTKWLWVDNSKFPKVWACENSTKFSPRTEVNDECASVFAEPPHSIFTDEILPTARAEPRYPDQIVKAVGDGLQATMFSGKSGEEAATLAADKIDRFLSSYKGAPLNPAA